MSTTALGAGIDRIRAAAAARGITVEEETETVEFADYVANPTQQRQHFWLGYTSGALAQHTDDSARLLDIGSNVHWLIGVAAGRTVEMVDVRPHPLAEVLPFRIHTANATSLPFANETFDAATLPQLLHWAGTGTYGDPLDVDADVRTLAEVSRVLKPGGVAIFTTFVVPGPTVFKVRGRRLFGIDELEGLLDRAGLNVVDLSLRDSSCREITREAVPERTRRVLVPGNPDEDLAWAICTVRKR